MPAAIQITNQKPHDKFFDPANQQELFSQEALPTTFDVQFQSNTSFLSRALLLIPSLFQEAGQAIARPLILPSTWLFSKQELTTLRVSLSSNESPFIKKNFSQRLMQWWQGPLVVRRFTISVDGKALDVCFSGTKSSLKSRKWVLAAMPNGMCYEQMLKWGSPLKELCSDLGATAVAFNYHGVGASQGKSNPETIKKAYQAVLHVLERELGAKTIVHYGLSMGGGAQALGLDGWESRAGVKHVCIKDRTFKSLSAAASGIFFPLGLAVHALGWQIDTAGASKRLAFPEIILQSDKAEGDGVIAKKAALGFALGQQKNKFTILAPIGHNDPVSLKPLATRVKALL